MVLKRADVGQLIANLVERLNPLAKHDRLLPTGNDFFQIRLQTLLLAARSRNRIEVADLFQAEHQLKHVLNREFVSKVGKLDDAFVLGDSIGGPLLGC